MPMNKNDYPDNWDFLSREVRKRAGNKCELCYAPNGEYVTRYEGQYPWQPAPKDQASEMIKIVLTVHHIDADRKNNSDKNLIALCQRCHLRLDLERHIKNRTRTKKDKKQKDLI